MSCVHPVRAVIKRCAVLALLITAPATMSAQVRRDSTLADSTAQRIQAVVVTGALNPATTGGAAELVIKPLEFNTSPSPVLTEVLRRTPFILVRQNSRGETEISMRGSESRQVSVSVDGMPLTLGWDNRTDASLLPVTGVRELRLVRGLSSLLEGPNMLGGVLDVSLSRPGRASLAERELAVATGVDAEGAVYGDVVAGSFLPLQSGASLSLRAGGGYRSSDGSTIPNNITDQYASNGLRTNTGFTQFNGFLAARILGESGRYAGVTALGYSGDRGVAPELHVEEPRFWKYPSVSRTLAIASAGSGVMMTPFGAGSLDARIGYTRGTVHIAAYEDAAYSTIDSEERGDERLNMAHLQLTHSLPLSGTLKAAFTGSRVSYEEILGTTHTDYEQAVWSSGAEVEFPLSSSLMVSGGLVNDASTTPETGGREALPRRSAWGWRAGASSLLMGDNARLHLSVSKRSRFPALRELYSGALNRFAPNPDLKPETLNGAEIGLSMLAARSMSHSLNLQAVLFHHDLTDGVVRTTLPDRRFFRVNRDHIRSSGLEFLATYMPSDRGLSLSADFLVQSIKVEDQTDGNSERQVEHQPEFKARAEVGVPLPALARGILSVRHQGTMYCVHPDAGTLVSLDAQTVGDLSFSRTFRLRSGGLLGSLKAVLGIDNITDGAVYDQCGLPQPGRTLRLGIQIF